MYARTDAGGRVGKRSPDQSSLTEDETLNYILDIVDRGILISLGGLVLFPPLTINQKIADQIVEAFDQSLRPYYARSQ
jgi:4-aminobutyrate aminotransferase-like enzyme